MEELLEKNGTELRAEEEIDLLELVAVLYRRRRLIIVITGMAAIVSLVIALLLPNIYTATAKVLPPQKEGGGITAALGQLGGLAAAAGIGGGFGGPADLYVSILKSRSVADAVIARLDLKKEFEAKTADDARKAYAATVKISSGSKDGILTVTADHKNPEFAAKLVQAAVDELGHRTVQLNIARNNSERIFLEKRLEVVQRDLKKAEEDIKNFSQKHKVIKIEEQSKASIETIAKLKAELASKEVQLAVKRSYQTDESPEVAVLATAVGRIKKELADMSGNGVGGEGIPSVGSIPSIGLEYLRRMREVKTQEAILEQLTKQFELAKINESRDATSLQILDEPVVPDRKSGPKRSLVVVLATVSGFFLSLVAAYTTEYIAKLPADERRRIVTLFGRG